MKEIIKKAKYETVEDFFGMDESLHSKEEVAGKATRAYTEKLRQNHEARASSEQVNSGRSTRSGAKRTTTARNSAPSSRPRATRPTNGTAISGGSSRKAASGSSRKSASTPPLRSSVSPGPSPKGADPNLLRWQKEKAQYNKLKSNKKRIEFINKHPGFDPKAGFEEAAKPAALLPDIKVGPGHGQREVEDKASRVIVCANCYHHHEGERCVCGCYTHEGDWAAALKRAQARVAEYERQIQTGELRRYVVDTTPDTEETFWPRPTVLDMTPEACARRDEMVTRMLALWQLKAHTDGKYREDFDYSRQSYRVVLAEKLLSAEIERYASAYRVVDRGPQTVAPDEVLIEQVRAAAGTLIAAHRKLPNHYRGNVEPGYVEYMRWLAIFSLPEGYSIHQEQDRMRGGMLDPDMLRKFG